MATINIPIEELIPIIKQNLPQNQYLKSIEPTRSGPKLGLKLIPIMPPMYVTIRFVRFDSGKAYFALDGMPSMVNVGGLLSLPKGITIVGSQLTVDADTLIKENVPIRGIKVTNFTWDGSVYIIYVSMGG